MQECGQGRGKYGCSRRGSMRVSVHVQVRVWIVAEYGCLYYCYHSKGTDITRG